MRGAAALGGAAVLAPGMLARALAEPAQPGPGPYGPYPADGGGKTVGRPPGFSSRVIARAGQTVGGSSYLWHPFPDGGATFPTPSGGWVYVSNSEVPALPLGGVGAVKFSSTGKIIDAYRILGGTSMNCAGGATPWNTWLSCEESATGLVYECNPFRAGQGVARPALGAFTHEAVAVDPVAKVLYLTEDTPTGRLYRFVPEQYPDLRKGTLSVARLDTAGHVTWLDIPDPSGQSKPTAQQRPNSTIFNGGEGIYRDGRWMYISTKGDDRIWAFDLDGQRIFPLYRAREHARTRRCSVSTTSSCRPPVTSTSPKTVATSASRSSRPTRSRWRRSSSCSGSTRRHRRSPASHSRPTVHVSTSPRSAPVGSASPTRCGARSVRPESVSPARPPTRSRSLDRGVDAQRVADEAAAAVAASLSAESSTPIIVGLVLCATGFVLIAYCWSQVALRKTVAAQLPWVVSAGFTGLGLIIVGGLAVATQVRRRDAERQLRRLELLVAGIRTNEDASL